MYRFALFSPSDLVVLAGVPEATQKAWRLEGILSSFWWREEVWTSLQAIGKALCTTRDRDPDGWTMPAQLEQLRQSESMLYAAQRADLESLRRPPTPPTKKKARISASGILWQLRQGSNMTSFKQETLELAGEDYVERAAAIIAERASQQEQTAVETPALVGV